MSASRAYEEEGISSFVVRLVVPGVTMDGPGGSYKRQLEGHNLMELCTGRQLAYVSSSRYVS